MLPMPGDPMLPIQLPHTHTWHIQNLYLLINKMCSVEFHVCVWMWRGQRAPKRTIWNAMRQAHIFIHRARIGVNTRWRFPSQWQQYIRYALLPDGPLTVDWVGLPFASANVCVCVCGGIVRCRWWRMTDAQCIRQHTRVTNTRAASRTSQRKQHQQHRCKIICLLCKWFCAAAAASSSSASTMNVAVPATFMRISWDIVSVSKPYETCMQYDWIGDDEPTLI